MRLQDRLEAMIKSRDSQLGKLGVRIRSLQNKVDKNDLAQSILLRELNAAYDIIYGDKRDKYETAEQLLADELSREITK